MLTRNSLYVLSTLVREQFNANMKFRMFCQNLVVPFLRNSFSLSSVACSLDQANTFDMYSKLLKIDVLHELLPFQWKCRQYLRKQSDLLLFLHPMFTSNRISLCPFWVFEVMCQIFMEKYRALPPVISL